MDYVVLSSAELILWREKAAQTGRKITDLLLRSGGIGYLDMERLLHESCDEARRVFKDKRRVNPVVLKMVMSKCGVLITPNEYRDLRTAYSDEGGFLVDEFLDLVRPSRSLGDSEARVLREMCADVIGASSEVALNELLQSLKGALVSGDDATVASPPFVSAMLEMEMIFTPVRYPSHCVPVRDVVEAIAALLLNNSGAAESLLHRLSAVKLAPAPVSGMSTQTPVLLESSALKRQERGYEYYTERDNRDEWIRGREVAFAGPMYQRYLPGFQGHLPTFKSKFGRSFHPIEESMPELTRPQKSKEPLPADCYGRAVELRGNWVNRHHFKFA